VVVFIPPALSRLHRPFVLALTELALAQPTICPCNFHQCHLAKQPRGMARTRGRTLDQSRQRGWLGKDPSKGKLQMCGAARTRLVAQGPLTHPFFL
jgi:hypothetical protein